MWRNIAVQPKWYLLSTFMILLAIKLDGTSYRKLPWLIVFTPLLLHNAFKIFCKVSESVGFYSSRLPASDGTGLWQFGCAVDQCGSFISSIGLYYFCDYGRLEYSNTSLRNRMFFLYSIPFFATITASTALRFYSLSARGCFDERSYGCSSGYYFCVAYMIITFLVRGLIPALFILRVYGYIANWSIVFIPLWVLSFMGFMLGILLILRAPMAHIGGPADLKSHAIGLINITAGHVLLFDLSVFITLTWITERLQNAENYVNSSSINEKVDRDNMEMSYSNYFIKNNQKFQNGITLSPLIFSLLVFLSMQPILQRYLKSYQTHLRGVHHQTLQQALVVAMKQEASLTVMKEKLWLLQVSSTLFSRMEHVSTFSSLSTAIDRRVLLTEPQDCIGICLSACFENSDGGWGSGTDDNLLGPELDTIAEGGNGRKWYGAGMRIRAGIGTRTEAVRWIGDRVRIGEQYERQVLKTDSSEIDRTGTGTEGYSPNGLEMATLMKHGSLGRDRSVRVNEEDYEEKLDQIHYTPQSIPLNQTLTSSHYETDRDSEIDLIVHSDSDLNPLLNSNRGNDSYSTSYRSGEMVEQNIVLQMGTKSSTVSLPYSPYQSGANSGKIMTSDCAPDHGRRIDTKWSIRSAWRQWSVSLNANKGCKGELQNNLGQKLAAEDQDSSLCVVCFGRVLDTCLLECGHCVLCFHCASMLARKVPSSCPLCRLPISIIARLTSFITLPDGGRLAVSGECYSVNTDFIQIYNSDRVRRSSPPQLLPFPEPVPLS